MDGSIRWELLSNSACAHPVTPVNLLGFVNSEIEQQFAYFDLAEIFIETLISIYQGNVPVI